MEKYLIFAGARYYPSGGYDDCIGTGFDIQEIKSLMEKSDHDWCQIVEATKFCLVLEGSCPLSFDPKEKWEWTTPE